MIYVKPKPVFGENPKEAPFYKSVPFGSVSIEKHYPYFSDNSESWIFPFTFSPGDNGLGTNIESESFLTLPHSVQV